MTVPDDLLEAARSALKNAYVPYSDFPVGAALRSASGVIYAGANVENASFGLTRCAEQSAVQALVSAGEREFTELVVCSLASEPASPCGACRQILFEFSPAARVLLVNDRGVTVESSVASLLPGGFSLTPPA
jgi:cytidine deaminase